MIKLESISKAFDKTVVLQKYSLTVNNGERVAIMGESGCGKTTLLRIVANLEAPDEGTVSGYSFDDIAYVFQESRLFDTLTVLDNVACVSHKPIKDARCEALTLLQAIGLSDSAALHPYELSGGMAQRVSIARALMADKPILLLDEPFSALDDTTRQNVIELIGKFCQNRTLILVTHTRSDAALLTSRIIEQKPNESSRKV